MTTPPQASARDAAIGIVRTLRDAGHTAYLAGGCVRDELLPHDDPPKDYDIATDATPDRVAQLFRRTREVGKSFGVMHVYQSGHTIEVATFRAEGPYSDSRRPDHVTFTNAEEDAQRRDFTINALFIDPLDTAADPRGKVIDFVKGERDLDAGIVRAVGDPDKRLAEDHLRALRAVRFSARLGFTLDAPTADAVRRHASELRGVSRERIGDECRRMLAHPTRADAASLMQRLTLDGPALDDECRPDAPTTTLAALSRDASYPLALAAWLIDRNTGEAPPTPERLDALSAQTIPRWRAALCLTNDERDEFSRTLALLVGLSREWGGWRVARRKRAASQDAFRGALEILSVHDAALAAEIRGVVAGLEDDPVGLAPDPLITGDDLVAAGLQPGPMFGKWLDDLYDLQLEGGLSTPAQALERALQWARAKD